MTRSVGPHSGLAPPVSEVLKKKRLRTLKYGFAMEISSEVVCIINVGVSIPLLRELGNAKSSVPFENKHDRILKETDQSALGSSRAPNE